MLQSEKLRARARKEQMDNPFRITKARLRFPPPLPLRTCTPLRHCLVVCLFCWSALHFRRWS